MSTEGSSSSEISSRYDALSLEFKKIMTIEAPHVYTMGSAHVANSMKESQNALREMDKSRPTNEELRGWVDSSLPNSSQHYLGVLPLTAHSQTPSVHLQASNCWKTHRYVIPKELKEYRQINKYLEDKYNDQKEKEKEKDE
jgi:hypothetical protein